MSAQETLFLQLATASTAALALITVSNPSPANDRLSEWSFSAVLLPEDAIITEASQPYMIYMHISTIKFYTMSYRRSKELAYLDKTIMEEETESCGDRNESLLNFSSNHISYNAFDVRTHISVVIRHLCGRKY